MFAPRYIMKQIMYAGLRPFPSEKLPMNVGARPWHTMYTVTLKTSKSAEFQKWKGEIAKSHEHNDSGLLRGAHTGQIDSADSNMKILCKRVESRVVNAC